MNLLLIVAGDMNINLLNPVNYVYVDVFVNNMFELGLTPIITRPTKINIANSITRFSLLDQIWTSQNLNNQQSFVLPLDITDHFPVGAILKLPFTILFENQRIRCRPLRQEGKITFSLLISNVNIEINDENFNNIYDNYFSNIFRCYDISFPIVSSNKKRKIHLYE